MRIVAGTGRSVILTWRGCSQTPSWLDQTPERLILSIYTPRVSSPPVSYWPFTLSIYTPRVSSPPVSYWPFTLSSYTPRSVLLQSVIDRSHCLVTLHGSVLLRSVRDRSHCLFRLHGSVLLRPVIDRSHCLVTLHGSVLLRSVVDRSDDTVWCIAHWKPLLMKTIIMKKSLCLHGRNVRDGNHYDTIWWDTIRYDTIQYSTSIAVRFLLRHRPSSRYCCYGNNAAGSKSIWNRFTVVNWVLHKV